MLLVSRWIASPMRGESQLTTVPQKYLMVICMRRGLVYLMHP